MATNGKSLRLPTWQFAVSLTLPLPHKGLTGSLLDDRHHKPVTHSRLQSHATYPYGGRGTGKGRNCLFFLWGIDRGKGVVRRVFWFPHTSTCQKSRARRAIRGSANTQGHIQPRRQPPASWPLPFSFSRVPRWRVCCISFRRGGQEKRTRHAAHSISLPSFSTDRHHGQLVHA